MASTTILSDNGASSGSAGVKTTGGNDGVLILQTTTSGGTATNAVTIDTSQNVGIGTSSPNAPLTVASTSKAISSRGNEYLFSTDSMAVDLGAQISLGGSYTGTSETFFAAVAGRKENSTDSNTAGYLQFSTRPAGSAMIERARIDSSGNLLVGTTSTTGSGKVNMAFASGSNGFSAVSTDNTSNASFMQMYANGSFCGNITRVGTTSAVLYGSASDYRLKESIKPMIGALEKVAQLKPVSYIWKENGSEAEGFIAHELQAVIPDAVSGEKDAVDADGIPVYQSIDTSFLVATLTAAIQEQQAIITTLTERITALEAK